MKDLPTKMALLPITVTFWVAAVFAQTAETGTLRGRVADSAGAVILNAEVIVTGPDGAEHKTRTIVLASSV